jgi:hypothetical protein
MFPSSDLHKEHPKRYGKYSNVFFDYEKNGQVTPNLWYAYPCTFCGLNNHCVAMCWKRKSLMKKVMSFKKKARCKDHSPSQDGENGKKGLLSKRMGKKYCTHCQRSGHWVDKCWNLHPHIFPKHGKGVVQAPTKAEVANERVGQVPTIQEALMKKITYPRKIPSRGSNPKRSIH